MIRTFDFYFAGELFDAKHLIGNAYLASEILKNSEGKFRPLLPQDLEMRSMHPHDIRDEDILALIESDLALFHFDGSDLDSGTVIEFMIAKFADIPAVILRSDFRSGGDQAEQPWNLMASYYPRTEVVIVDALRSYKFSESSFKNADKSLLTDPRKSIDLVTKLNTMISHKVINAFERVIQTPALLKGEQQESVYNWLQSMCAYKRSKADIQAIFERVIARKKELNQSSEAPPK
jgi:nucleoside 2-deoxyribosyltransferase